MLVNIHIPVQYTQCLENPGILRHVGFVLKNALEMVQQLRLFHRTVFRHIIFIWVRVKNRVWIAPR